MGAASGYDSWAGETDLIGRLNQPIRPTSLPFCMVFVSGDKLHRRCAPLFLRQDQDFLWGQDLKVELKRINAHLSEFSTEVKEKDIMAFAHHPPGDDSTLMGRLRDRHLRWHDVNSKDRVTKPVKNTRLTEEVKKITSAQSLEPSEIDFDPQHADSMIIQRRVSKRKGNWWQLPKDLEDPDDD